MWKYILLKIKMWGKKYEFLCIVVRSIHVTEIAEAGFKWWIRQQNVHPDNFGRYAFKVQYLPIENFVLFVFPLRQTLESIIAFCFFAKNQISGATQCFRRVWITFMRRLTMLDTVFLFTFFPTKRTLNKASQCNEKLNKERTYLRSVKYYPPNNINDVLCYQYIYGHERTRRIRDNVIVILNSPSGSSSDSDSSSTDFSNNNAPAPNPTSADTSDITNDFDSPSNAVTNDSLNPAENVPSGSTSHEAATNDFPSHSDDGTNDSPDCSDEKKNTPSCNAATMDDSPNRTDNASNDSPNHRNDEKNNSMDHSNTTTKDSLYNCNDVTRPEHSGTAIDDIIDHKDTTRGDIVNHGDAEIRDVSGQNFISTDDLLNNSNFFQVGGASLIGSSDNCSISNSNHHDSSRNSERRREEISCNYRVSFDQSTGLTFGGDASNSLIDFANVPLPSDVEFTMDSLSDDQHLFFSKFIFTDGHSSDNSSTYFGSIEDSESTSSSGDSLGPDQLFRPCSELSHTRNNSPPPCGTSVQLLHSNPSTPAISSESRSEESQFWQPCETMFHHCNIRASNMRWTCSDMELLFDYRTVMSRIDRCTRLVSGVKGPTYSQNLGCSKFHQEFVFPRDEHSNLLSSLSSLILTIVRMVALININNFSDELDDLPHYETSSFPQYNIEWILRMSDYIQKFFINAGLPSSLESRTGRENEQSNVQNNGQPNADGRIQSNVERSEQSNAEESEGLISEESEGPNAGRIQSNEESEESNPKSGSVELSAEGGSRQQNAGGVNEQPSSGNVRPSNSVNVQTNTEVVQASTNCFWESRLNTNQIPINEPLGRRETSTHDVQDAVSSRCIGNAETEKKRRRLEVRGDCIDPMKPGPSGSPPHWLSTAVNQNAPGQRLKRPLDATENAAGLSLSQRSGNSTPPKGTASSPSSEGAEIFPESCLPATNRRHHPSDEESDECSKSKKPRVVFPGGNEKEANSPVPHSSQVLQREPDADEALSGRKRKACNSS